MDVWQLIGRDHANIESQTTIQLSTLCCAAYSGARKNSIGGVFCAGTSADQSVLETTNIRWMSYAVLDEPFEWSLRMCSLAHG